MKLKRKPLKVKKARIEDCINDMNDSLGHIECLKKLQSEFETLETKEFLLLVSIIYDFGLDEEDFEKIVETLLKSKNIKTGKIKTGLAKQEHRNGLGPIWNEWYDVYTLDAQVFYTDKSEIDFDHVYSKKELAEMIENKRIVLDSFWYGYRVEGVYELSERKANEYKEFVPLKEISLQNLGVCEEAVVRNIKRRLQSKRFASDLVKLIREVRSIINGHRALAFEERCEHERQAKHYQGIYTDCITNLDSLSEMQKEALGRIRENKKG